MPLPLPWHRRALLQIWKRFDAETLAVFAYINAMTRRRAYLLSTLILAGIAAADYYTHVELMFSPYYAIPCILVDWRIGRMQALLYGLFAWWVQAEIAELAGHPYSHEWYSWADLALNLLYYGALIWLVAKLRTALEMEKVLSRVDFLTKLANRRSFLEALGVEHSRCRRYRHNFTLVLIDCDGFTEFVDEQGFSTGDLLLVAVAEELLHLFRNTDFVARSGKNEFALILPETPAANSAAKLKSMHQELNVLALDRGWPVTFSVACVSYQPVPESAEIALARARALLREIKRTGKNRLECEVLGGESITAFQVARNQRDVAAAEVGAAAST